MNRNSHINHTDTMCRFYPDNCLLEAHALNLMTLTTDDDCLDFVLERRKAEMTVLRHLERCRLPHDAELRELKIFITFLDDELFASCEYKELYNKLEAEDGKQPAGYVWKETDTRGFKLDKITIDELEEIADNELRLQRIIARKECWQRALAVAGEIACAAGILAALTTPLWLMPLLRALGVTDTH